MKKHLFLLVAIMFATVARAADGDSFSFDGLNYTVLSEADHTVKVGENKDLSGDVNIPGFVTRNGSSYIVTSIGDGAFYGCSSMTSVTIPSSVILIGDYAFYECSSLTSVTIPDSVTSIGTGAFYDCSSLTDIIVENGNEFYCSENGALYNCDMTVLIQCPGAKTEFNIPNSVTSIGDYAFRSCRSLISVTIPNSVTSIGNGAFIGCSSMTSVAIPNSVTSIGDYAFHGCSSMTSVTIPNSVTSISEGAFYGCIGMTSVTIPNSVISIGYYAFYGCISLTSVTIPNSVTSIGTGAFYDCSSLTDIIVENGNEFYCSENGALYNGDMTVLIQCPGAKTEFNIPNSVTSIGDGAFYDCRSLTSVTIPNSVTSIGNEAFHCCSSLTSVAIPNSVTSIGNEAFIDCSSLTSVTIPNSVTSIGDYTFYYCSRLNKIIDLNPTPQTVGSYAFYNVPTDAAVYIPKGSSTAYMVADGWNQFSDFREMGALDISISASTLELAEGESTELTVTVVKDDDVTAGDHEWVSSNPEVATVENGKVTAVAPGTAVITYTIYDGYGVAHSESCKVTVATPVILVQSITLDQTAIEAKEGSEVQLTATVTPDDATNKEIAWSSSDETVAAVSTTGLVKILKEGSCIITAATTDGSGLRAECTVTALSGIPGILDDATVMVDVFNLQGIGVLRNATAADIHTLPAGIYIVRRGGSVEKISVK